MEISLTYIFGIGRSTSEVVCQQTGLSPDTRVRDLTEDEVAKLRTFIDANLKVEGDLRREIAGHIKRKIEIGTYQGIRHRRASRCAASARARMRGPARARRRPSPAARRPASRDQHTTGMRRPAPEKHFTR